MSREGRIDMMVVMAVGAVLAALLGLWSPAAFAAIVFLWAAMGLFIERGEDA